MKEDFKKILLHIILFIGGSAVLGTVLLVLSFCIPTERIQAHVKESVDKMLPDEATYPENVLLRYILRYAESYTDSIMVQYAFEKIPDKNAFEHAMWAYHYDLEEEIWAAEDSLKAVLAGADTSDMHLREYSRYWHGYLIYLKPLLLLFNWEQVVIIGVGFQLFLLLALFVSSARKGHIEVAIAVYAGLLFMKPVQMVVSLTMSVCLIITLCAILFLLRYHDWLQNKGYYPEFFLVIGILTAYFDFLTYPLVTLGFPLCALLLLERQDAVMGLVKRIVGTAVCWGIGYAGMWSAKWVIADLTLHTGTIRDAVWNVIGRTESIGGRPRLNGGFYVISLNLQEYQAKGYGILVAIFLTMLVLVLAWAIWQKVPFHTILKVVISYGMISLFPFGWIIVVQHHSALHARFTFRILGVAAMAISCMVLQIIKEKISKKTE